MANRYPDTVYLEHNYIDGLRQADFGRGEVYYSSDYLERQIRNAKSEAQQQVEAFISALRELLNSVE